MLDFGYKGSCRVQFTVTILSGFKSPDINNSTYQQKKKKRKKKETKKCRPTMNRLNAVV